MLRLLRGFVLGSADDARRDDVIVALSDDPRRRRSALLVYHQRRIGLVFSRAFTETDLIFANVPADDPDLTRCAGDSIPIGATLTPRELGKFALAYLNR